MTAVKAQVRIVVSGRVQGVFFRAATAQEARGLGLAGWVRNRLDGRVEIRAEGRAREPGDAGGLVQPGPAGGAGCGRGGGVVGICWNLEWF
jgi:acylphosphatase